MKLYIATDKPNTCCTYASSACRFFMCVVGKALTMLVSKSTVFKVFFFIITLALMLCLNYSSAILISLYIIR